MFISEAISANQYISIVRDAIYDSIQESLVTMQEFLSPKAKAEFNSDNTSHARFIDLAKLYLQDGIELTLPAKLIVVLNNALGSRIVQGISFEDIPALGLTTGVSFKLRSKYVKDISGHIIDRLVQIVYDNYSSGDRADGFYDICNQLAKNKRGENWHYMLVGADLIIPQLISTIIHELIHVLQHHEQYIRKRGMDTEYRSYLDKEKGEMQSVIKKYEQERKQGQVSPKTWDRYMRLYYASPQEIAAFAHNAAQEVILNYGYEDAETVDELQLSGINASDILDAIDTVTSKWVKNPRTPKEAAVRKRYIKLVYQEVARYLNYKIEQLRSQANP